MVSSPLGDRWYAVPIVTEYHCICYLTSFYAYFHVLHSPLFTLLTTKRPPYVKHLFAQPQAERRGIP